MSRSNKRRLSGAERAALFLLIGAALACVRPASATDEAVDSVSIGSPATELVNEGKPGSAPTRAAEERPAATAGKSTKSARSLFRCWQGGRQVFEGRGYGAMPQSQVAAELKGGEGSTGRLQVLDMYDGFCVLELPK
jgi:hypothetical protein